jgi:hypothetical protein
MFDFIFYTIPHSGTHFMFELFSQLDVPRYGYSGTFIDNNPYEKESRRPHYFHIHSKERPTYHHIHWGLLHKHKVLSIVRHPYDNFISHLSRNLDMEECSNVWKIFMDVDSKCDVYSIDINSKNRMQSIYEGLEHVGIRDQVDDNIIQDYVRTWKPQNHWNTPVKREYDETGKMPPEHDYSMLEPALNWYLEKFPYNK